MISETLSALQSLMPCNHISIDIFYGNGAAHLSVLICDRGDLAGPA